MNLTKAKETKTRVCCLYRVSTKGQVDKAENDIPMQKKACHEFAESKGWTIIKEHAELALSLCDFSVLNTDNSVSQALRSPRQIETNCRGSSGKRKNMSLISCWSSCSTVWGERITKRRLY